MIPKISRLNKIISIASVYSLNRRHKCFENRFNPREFAEPPCCRLCSSNGLTNDYQKLTIDSRSSKESRSLFLSPTFASCTAWTVFVLFHGELLETMPQFLADLDSPTFYAFLFLAREIARFCKIPRTREIQAINSIPFPSNGEERQRKCFTSFR